LTRGANRIGENEIAAAVKAVGRHRRPVRQRQRQVRRRKHVVIRVRQTAASSKIRFEPDGPRLRNKQVPGGQRVKGDLRGVRGAPCSHSSPRLEVKSSRWSNWGRWRKSFATGLPVDGDDRHAVAHHNLVVDQLVQPTLVNVSVASVLPLTGALDVLYFTVGVNDSLVHAVVIAENHQRHVRAVTMHLSDAHLAAAGNAVGLALGGQDIHAVGGPIHTVVVRVQLFAQFRPWIEEPLVGGAGGGTVEDHRAVGAGVEIRRIGVAGRQLRGGNGRRRAVGAPRLSTGSVRYQWLKSKFCPGGRLGLTAKAQPAPAPMTKMAKARRQVLDLFLFFFIFCFPGYPATILVQLAPRRKLPLTGFAANLGKSGAFHINSASRGEASTGVYLPRQEHNLSAFTAKELAATFFASDGQRNRAVPGLVERQLSEVTNREIARRPVFIEGAAERLTRRGHSSALATKQAASGVAADNPTER